MKYYSYSVKDVINGFFGENAVFEMRKSKESHYTTREDYYALSWKYADSLALGFFDEERFLTDTILEDDYIVYIFKNGAKEYAWLMFIIYEENAPFTIDVEYADSIIKEWESKGYTTSILSQCIGVSVNDSDNCLRFDTYSSPEKEAKVYCVTENDGMKLLEIESRSCWQYFYDKLISVTTLNDIREYECLFAHYVVLTQGKNRSKEILGKGYEAVKKFFEEKGPVKVLYSKFLNTSVCTKETVAGDKKLCLYVNCHNLISEINISDLKREEIVCYKISGEIKSLVDNVPKLLSVRVLNHVDIHGWGLQLRYADGSLRNYYIGSFEGWEILETVIINGYSFDKEQFETAYINDKNGVSFENGYSIESHIIYYKSYRQVESVKLDRVYYDKNGMKIQSVYRLPLKEFINHFSIKHYCGNEDECTGPANGFFDENGDRKSDASFYHFIEDPYDITKPRLVTIEPTGKYGYLNDDGTWFAPPIYEKAEDFETSCIEVSRMTKNGLENFLLNLKGKEIPFQHKTMDWHFSSGLCPFSIGEAPEKGTYYNDFYQEYDDVNSGIWGYINDDGEVVVEPQYIYATGFYAAEKYAVVAKVIDGDVRWGGINTKGEETIPVIYKNLYTRWGEAVIFENEENNLYGMMDFEGNIIVEPQFNYIDEYNKEHNLITAGDHEYAQGVFSLDENRYIIPPKYDCVDYDDHIINCEISYTCGEEHFNYQGEKLDFPDYDHVFESNGYFKVLKNGKCGAVDFEGNIIVPLVYNHPYEVNVDLYNEGIVITSSDNREGLSVKGKEILPSVYDKVCVTGEMAIVTEVSVSGHKAKEKLITLDGEMLLDGCFKIISYYEEEKKIVIKTPFGKEFLRIV